MQRELEEELLETLRSHRPLTFAVETIRQKLLRTTAMTSGPASVSSSGSSHEDERDAGGGGGSGGARQPDVRGSGRNLGAGGVQAGDGRVAGIMVALRFGSSAGGGGAGTGSGGGGGGASGAVTDAALAEGRAYILINRQKVKLRVGRRTVMKQAHGDRLDGGCRRAYVGACGCACEADAGLCVRMCAQRTWTLAAGCSSSCS